MATEIDSYLLKCVLEALEEGFEPEKADVECACRLGLTTTEQTNITENQ